jgi:hypothetical protein
MEGNINVFNKYPILIDLVNPNGVLKTRYLFIGNVPEHIKTDVEEVLSENITKNIQENLSKYYGPKWKETLGILGASEKTRAIGAQDLDILDISDIISEDTKKKVKEEKEEKPIKKMILIHDIHIYPEDRISELKEKISIILPECPIFKQHLYTREYGPLYYRIISDIAIHVDIENISTTKTHLLGLAVDNDLYQNRENIQIEAFDYFTTVGEIYTKWNTRHFKLINMDDFMKGREKQLDEMSRSDSYQFNMIYYSFILKFWPMLTLEAFQVYVRSPQDLHATYPDLSPNIENLRKKYESERKSLDYKYTLLSDLPDNFKKYSPEQAQLSTDFNKTSQIKNKIVDISIKSAVLTMEREILWGIFDLSSYIKINLRNLFEELRIDESIPFVRVHLPSSNGTVLLTKIKSPLLVEGDSNDIPRVFEKIKYRIQLPHPNTLLIAVPISNDLYLILTIYENGKYQVKSSWGEEIQINFSTMFNLIEKTINPIINQINNLGRGVFDSINHLPLINKTTTEFSGLYLSIFWKIPITTSQFRRFGDLLKLESDSEIIHISPDIPDVNTFDYQMLKGMTNYDIQDIEQNIYAYNYYEYLTNSKVKQRWNQLFAGGRYMRFIYRATDIKVEIQDLKENEFQYFYEYIISLFYRFEKQEKQEKKANVETKQEKSEKKTNRLKVLKSKDPELYVFKKFGSDVVYSRICQKDHQPLMYDENELQNLDMAVKNKAIKFWNYTTNQPAYYMCANPKYPYLNFIVGQHPRGYCLPCCKKTPASVGVNKLSKKDHIYNTCMQHYIYSEEDTKGGPSRYIMNYGKTIEIGRIGNLPEIVGKYLLYNLQDKDILIEEQIPRVFIYKNKTYAISDLIKITKHSKVKDIPLSDVLTLMEKPMKEYLISNSIYSAAEILKNPELDPIDYNRISNADVLQPLLILRDGNTLTLIEGIYRLAKAILVKDGNIHVKVITNHQLEKAIVNSSDTRINGGNLRKSGYYLFGVSQNNANISNIGAGYSISTALNMSFPEFIEKVVIFFRSYRGSLDYFRILYNGGINEFFASLDDLLEQMFGLFVEEETSFFIGEKYLKKFPGWNDLFIEIAEICFGKKILLLDDTSVDVAGTSIKSVRATENIDFILPNLASFSSSTDINDFIPDISTGGIHEYILLLRKKKKAKTLFSSNHIYYPIFLFIPQTFFKNSHVEKKIFSNGDEIVQLLRSILSEVISKIPIASSNFIDLQILKQFSEKNDINIAFDKYYMNSQNMCYAVLVSFSNSQQNVEKKRRRVIWPIQYSKVPLSVPENLKSFEMYKRSENESSFSDCKILYGNYNKFIIQLSEEKGYYQIAPEESEYKSSWNQREKTILPPNPLIKVERFLTLENEIIGFVSKGLYYYFNPVNIKPVIYANLIEEAIKGYSILIEGFKKLPTKYSSYCLFYDPDDINKKLLLPNNEESTYREKLNEALYHRYLYNIFVIEFISSLDSERNDQIRTRLYEIIERTKLKKTTDIENVHSQIDKLLEEHPNDISRIKQYLNQILSENFDRRKILDNIKNDVFEFDRKTLHEYYLIANEENRQKLFSIVKKRAESVVHISKKKGKKGNFPHVFVPCNNNSDNPYCNGKKIFVSKEDYLTLIDLLVEDFLNPLKREYLFSSIITNNTRDNFKFTRKKGEEIYVKYYG